MTAATSTADCLLCGYKNAMSITTKNGRKLYYCHAGCEQAELWAVIGGPENWSYRNPIKRGSADNGLRQYIRRLWGESLPAHKTAVDRYLGARGIMTHIPFTLRFLPRHRHAPTGTFWPVMLAAVTDHAGKLHALHRTYLTADGKRASVEPVKMTRGVVKGYATHLTKARDKLVITEGIETGLSILCSTALPTWAALSAGGIERLILPPLPLAREVIIAADNDASGRGKQAAENAAKRWLMEGRRVRIAMPSTPDTDFNDVLREIA